MKYLLIALLLLTTVNSPGTEARFPPPAERLQIGASFARVAGEVDTQVSLFVDRWPDRARLTLQLRRSSPGCESHGEVCQEAPVSMEGRAWVPIADVVVARDLSWASIHATVHIQDNLATRHDTVSVDLQLSARGPIHASDCAMCGYYSATGSGVIAGRAGAYVLADQTAELATIARTGLD